MSLSFLNTLILFLGVFYMNVCLRQSKHWRLFSLERKQMYGLSNKAMDKFFTQDWKGKKNQILYFTLTTTDH